MKPFDVDWVYVRRHTFRPVASALVALAVLVTALWVHGQQLQQYSQHSANHNAVHEDYDALVAQRRVVDRYHRRYQQLHDLGFIGRESRLDWIETLRLTAESLKMPRVSYAIEPQLEVVAPVQSARAGDEIQIRVSRVQLEMGLIHELDLLRFLDELQEQAPGLMKVDQCEVTWLADTGPVRSTESNLAAICAVQIFSVITSDVVREATGS